MIPIPQGDTSIPIPFPILANGGDFSGADGANPTVKISKRGATPIDAAGKVVPVGGGGYWFWPASQDVDTPGPVMMFVSAPSGDIVSWPGYFIQAPTWLGTLSQLPSMLLTFFQNSNVNTNNIRLLTLSQVSAAQKGEVQ